jgi:hypothetical protein
MPTSFDAQEESFSELKAGPPSPEESPAFNRPPTQTGEAAESAHVKPKKI